ncbi:MAG: transposase [Candidatus Zixiibacteriota bacterium]
MPKLKHYDDLGTARFVTFCCYRMEKSLADHRSKELLIKHLDLARTKHGFKIIGYVIMPEHVHLVLIPPDKMKLGLVVGEIKSLMAREFFVTAHGGDIRRHVFWQKRCYDHNCRTTDVAKEKISYWHYNPVRRGLVSQPADYRWSNYNWYAGSSEFPLKIDAYEFR